jgi:hypothetical protein
MLPDYLAGRVPEPEFGLLVEHEASCAACQQFASEQMSPLSEYAGSKASRPTAEEDLAIDRILERTVGRDCRWVEMRLAEAVDAPLDPEISALVENHVTDCSACRALSAVVGDLPAFYAVYPRLRAGRVFAREVVARTAGPKPGVFEVLRALWRRPEAVWEGAVACALLIAPLAGEPILTGFHMAGKAGQVTGQQMDVGDVWDALTDEIAELGSRIDQLRAKQGAASEVRLEETRAWARESFGRVPSPAALSDSLGARAPSWTQSALERLGFREPVPQTVQPEGEAHSEGDDHELH